MVRNTFLLSHSQTNEWIKNIQHNQCSPVHEQMTLMVSARCHPYEMIPGLLLLEAQRNIFITLKNFK